MELHTNVCVMIKRVWFLDLKKDLWTIVFRMYKRMKERRLYAHLTSKKIPKRLEGRVWPGSDTSNVRLYWADEES